ncbi:MAG: BamA/TamA family outer membrane protein [bacterium]
MIYLRRNFFPFILTFSFLIISKALTQDATSKHIRHIEIKRQDVFPEITGKPRFLYQWANSLHIVTRESVVRQELLFKKGDVFDPELLEESERNLRRRAYFGEALVKVKNEERDSVDVLVVTQDQWSTLFSTIIEQSDGRTVLGGAVEEFNFLGLGKQIYAELQHERTVGSQWSFRYTDPQILGTRWTTLQSFVTGPLVSRYFGQLVRPFYALDTRWAFGVAGSVDDSIVRIFEAGDERNRYRSEINQFSVFGARALGGRFTKTRLQLRYRFAERDFSTIGEDPLVIDEIPTDELIHSLSTRLSFENLHFVKEKQIDKFLRTEDLTLGSFTTFNLGRTGLPIPKGVKRFEFSASRREAHRIFHKQYLIALLGFQTLFEKNTIGFLRLKYYNKLLPHQTLALNFEMDYAIDFEVPRPFLLGGDSGLRGFPAREFTGDKRMLFNFEDRLFSSLNILTVALGGVLFFDAGHVWSEEQSVNLRDLNYSVGFGLRLGYTKSPRSRVGRIDFGWPLKGGSGLGITIGVDQQFSIN